MEEGKLCLRRVYLRGNRRLGFPDKLIGICGREAGHKNTCLTYNENGRAIVKKAPYHVAR